MKKTIKVAILGESLTSWGGGLDFLYLCANALVFKGKTEPIELFLFIPKQDSLVWKLKDLTRPYRYAMRDMLNFQIPHWQRVNRIEITQVINRFDGIIDRMQVIFYINHYDLSIKLKKIQVNVVLPVASHSLGLKLYQPWIGYITDFQYAYYPHFFSSTSRNSIETNFKGIVESSKATIVNSQAVKSDIERFFPNANCKIFPLPFSASPNKNYLEQNNPQLADLYNLPSRYFLISNQFWFHKSHLTAFEAFAILINWLNTKKDISLICTGVDSNPFSTYINSLKRRIGELGLNDRIYFLGYLPKKDQIQIMRGAIAVLQPTLFEGGPGGGAVYDAIAMGVPAIVSNIQVNLEIQNEDRIFFFESGSANDMAIKMLNVIKQKFKTPDPKNLIYKGNQRTNSLGNALLEAIQYVLE
jgi:glycosyltransferase involved in cell wall biosynthesis